MSLQVFHSLLKAHTMEARSIVRQAMAILTPAVPARMEDGHQMLTHWTRKIIVEEGHTVPQLVHILHLIVQPYSVTSRQWNAEVLHLSVQRDIPTLFPTVRSIICGLVGGTLSADFN